MANYSIVKVINDIDESFRDNSFSAVDVFLRNIKESVHSANYEQDAFNVDIQYDNGTGRVSQGLKTLYLLSLIIMGKTNLSIRRLQNAILIPPTGEFMTMDKETSNDTVLKVLGLFTVMTPLKNRNIKVVNDMISLVDSMVVDIKQGKFVIDKYKRATLLKSKEIITYAFNTSIQHRNIT